MWAARERAQREARDCDHGCQCERGNCRTRARRGEERRGERRGARANVCTSTLYYVENRTWVGNLLCMYYVQYYYIYIVCTYVGVDYVHSVSQSPPRTSVPTPPPPPRFILFFRMRQHLPAWYAHLGVADGTHGHRYPPPAFSIMAKFQPWPTRQPVAQAHVLGASTCDSASGSSHVQPAPHNVGRVW